MGMRGIIRRVNRTQTRLMSVQNQWRLPQGMQAPKGSACRLARRTLPLSGRKYFEQSFLDQPPDNGRPASEIEGALHEIGTTFLPPEQRADRSCRMDWK